MHAISDVPKAGGVKVFGSRNHLPFPFKETFCSHKRIRFPCIGATFRHLVQSCSNSYIAGSISHLLEMKHHQSTHQIKLRASKQSMPVSKFIVLHSHLTQFLWHSIPFPPRLHSVVFLSWATSKSRKTRSKRGPEIHSVPHCDFE